MGERRSRPESAQARPRRGTRGLFLLLLLLLALSSGRAARAEERMPDPEDGTMAIRSYANPYFGLAYPFLHGWRAGTAGPPPSAAGYYVLGAVDSKDGISGNLLIAAQDMLFSPQPIDNAMALIKAARKTMAALVGMQIDREPMAVSIGGRDFGRLDYSGVGLYRTMLATEIRCHLVSFIVTANDPALLDEAALSLAHLSLPPEPAARAFGSTEAGPGFPVCIKDYAIGDNLLRRIEPRAAAPYFARIPVRIIIGPDGSVKHTHVIRGSEEQRKNIEEALVQWRLKPRRVNGDAVDVETGLTFEFKPPAQ
jgi:Gram-negative bacterial TonB protein C-terminal